MEIWLFAAIVSAQQIEMNIKVVTSSPAVLRVEGRFLQKRQIQNEKNWSFLRSFAGGGKSRRKNFRFNFDGRAESRRSRQKIDGRRIFSGTRR